MIDALRKYQGAQPFTLEIVDVDADPELETAFGDRVPVLLAGDREICHYFLDPVALDAYLAEFR